jgi:hypothetical protein
VALSVKSSGSIRSGVKNILCCLALSAVSALSGTVGGSGAPLRIYSDFRVEPARTVENSLRSELASLVAPIGLNLEWRSLSAPRFGETSPALVVVTFLGNCDTTGLEPHYVDVGPLAWTHISDGVILPFVDVDCTQLRNILQSRLLKLNAKGREQLFGRALARVLGHELYHVFAETRHHGREGVAQPAFTAGELLSERFDFGEREFRTLRTSKLRALLSFHKPGDQTSHSGQAEYEADGCAACHGSTGQGSRSAPALRAKTLDARVLAARFEKKRENMFRRARSLNLEWLFPTDAEVASIVAALEAGLE